MKHEITGNKGDNIKIHIGEFFGVHDYHVQTMSKWKITIEYEEEPIDLIKEQEMK